MRLHSGVTMRLSEANGWLKNSLHEVVKMAAPFNSKSYYSRGRGYSTDDYENDGNGTAADGEIGGQDEGYCYFTCSRNWPREEEVSRSFAIKALNERG